MTNVILVFATGLTAGGLSCLAVQGGMLASSLAGGMYNQGSSPTLSNCTLMNDVSPFTPEIRNEPYSLTPRTASTVFAATGFERDGKRWFRSF